jgi:hypothetical protein
LHKLKKHYKTKGFEAPAEDLDIKMPQNTVETPDLPAGVDIPPVMPQEPELPVEPPIVDNKPEKPIKKEAPEKPKELQQLYGPDHDNRDDHVIHTPKTPDDLDDLLSPFLENEEPLGIPEEAIPEEEPEAPEELDVAPEEIDLQQTVPNPPVHEFCHCEIITMPGGRRIWKANSNACSQCLQARDTFNQWQASLFGT